MSIKAFEKLDDCSIHLADVCRYSTRTFLIATTAV
jgi:hypothetical protein